MDSKNRWIGAFGDVQLRNTKDSEDLWLNDFCDVLENGTDDGIRVRKSRVYNIWCLLILALENADLESKSKDS